MQVLVCVPEPQVVEHEPHEPHDVITFGSQQGCVLQLCVSVTVPPHWFVFVLVFVPPPQLAEQEPNVPYDVIILGSQELIWAVWLESPSPPPLTAATL